MDRLDAFLRGDAQPFADFRVADFRALFALLSLWAAFWVIRLGVRYGVNDALRKNRAWLRPDGQPRA